MFSNYYEVREWLEGFIPQVYGKEELGLERIEYLLKPLGNPQGKFKAIHIAGTAGKGSTCFYISRLLCEGPMANGQWPKIGLHVSPHLVDIRERMQVFQGGELRVESGKFMPIDRFLKLFNEIKPFVESMRSSKVGDPSYFEILVAASFKYFAEEKVDFAVVEVGLGGRLDATNVLNPEVSVITNVGLDHTEILGHTIARIAKEKAGIIKSGIPIVTAASGKALKVIEKVAKNKGSELVKVNTQKLPTGLSQMPFSDAPFLAIATLEELEINVDKKVLQNIFRETFAGRFEEIGKGVIIDGAHNPEKIKALLNFLREFQIPNSKFQIILVLAFKKGKDWQKMVDLLLENLPVKMVIATRYHAVTDTGKGSGVEPGEIEGYLESKWKVKVDSLENSQEAVFEALRLRSGSSTLVLVTGSLYLVGEARTMWELPGF